MAKTLTQTEKVPIEEAAQILGVSIPCVRERMRRGIYPIGICISKKQSGKSCDRFEIYRNKLNAFVAKEE